MGKIEKTLKYSKLFNLYGELLSESQKDIFTDYFLADLSISEISENRGISRAAVEDAINKATTKLDAYESVIKGLDKNEKIRAKLMEIRGFADKNEQIRLIDELLEEVK